MKNLLSVEGCKDYLIGMDFTDISFHSETDTEMYFYAVDDDDKLKKICFEQTSSELVTVSILDPEENKYYILEVLHKDF